MKKYVIPALFGVALGASACEGTIDFDGPGRDPKMIVGAVIGPNYNLNGDSEEDDLHSVHVTESIFLFGDRPYDSPRGEVEGAAFTIRRNGVEVQKDVKTYEDGTTHTYYHIPVATGDRLELEGTSLRHGSVSASDVVPAPADFRRLETEWFKSDGDEWYLRTRVTIADPADERNYYRFTARSLTKTKYTQIDRYGDNDYVFYNDLPRTHSVYVDSEIAFSNAVGDPAMGTMTWSAISDELFDGREYTFDVYIQLDRPTSTSEDEEWGREEILSQSVTVEVQTLSENLFKYRHSADIQGHEHNFSEPTQIYSNVAGGYGIFGAYNVASKTTELELLETDD